MVDRTVKFLLSAIALLLLALSLHSWLGPLSVQAQTLSGSPSSASQMVVDGNNIYVLQNGQLRLYSISTDSQGHQAIILEASKDTQVVAGELRR